MTDFHPASITFLFSHKVIKWIVTLLISDENIYNYIGYYIGYKYFKSFTGRLRNSTFFYRSFCLGA